MMDKKEFFEALEKHLEKELKAALFYLDMARRAREKNLDHYAELAASWSREELEHALDLGFLLADLGYNSMDKDLADLMQEAEELERVVAESLQSLLELARKEGIGFAEQKLLHYLQHALDELQEKEFHLRRITELGEVQADAFLGSGSK